MVAEEGGVGGEGPDLHSSSNPAQNYRLLTTRYIDFQCEDRYILYILGLHVL